MPRYGHKSDPQTHADEILMTASVELMIFGTSRSSKRTSRGPYRTAPRIFISSFRFSRLVVSVRCSHHRPRVRYQSRNSRQGCKAREQQTQLPQADRVDRDADACSRETMASVGLVIFGSGLSSKRMSPVP